MINLQWGTQQNGRIDTTLLVDVSGRGDYLEPTAAAQFKRMQAAILADVGFDLQPASGSSAYRPESVQITFFGERYTKVSYNSGLWWNGSYWTKKPGVSVAAVPGTSNHGWARAIDLNISSLDVEAWAWMLAHAAEYGYSWATGRASGEDWHWESLTPPGTTIASVGASLLTNTTPIRRDPTMIIISSASRGQVLITEGDGAFALRSDVALVHRICGVPAVDLKPDNHNVETDAQADSMVDTMIREAWERSNLTRDRIEQSVSATISAAQSNAES